MPNHLHCIVWLDPDEVGAQTDCAPKEEIKKIQRPGVKKALTGGQAVSHSRPILGQVIRSFKSQVTRKMRNLGQIEFDWQRGYYDHIIRTDESLNRIREYIRTNQLRWEFDRYNPKATGIDEEAIELWDHLRSIDFELHELK